MQTGTEITQLLAGRTGSREGETGEAAKGRRWRGCVDITSFVLHGTMELLRNKDGRFHDLLKARKNTTANRVNKQ